MRVLTVVGARPQFIKAAVLSAEFSKHRDVEEILVHTGQHYDYEMSQVFFDELKLVKPNYHLEVGSASHAVQTAEIMKRLEPHVENERPDWVLVYGDTNSTLGGALVAAKLLVPVAHVEAGLRSFNRSMPEETNRVVADHVASLLFAPHEHAARQLVREGIKERIEVVGDLMVDLVMETAASLPAHSPILDRFGVAPGGYGVVTVHRASNTDDPLAFARIVKGLRRLKFPVVFPVHPRTTQLAQQALAGERGDNIIACEPLSYRAMIALQRHASVILTDSGGMQKEAYALGVPCVTLRKETEWVETLNDGWNALAGTDPDAIARLALRKAPVKERRPHYGDGRCARRICEALARVGETVAAQRVVG